MKTDQDFRKRVQEALAATSTVREAAERLGMSFPHLYKKLKDFGITPAIKKRYINRKMLAIKMMKDGSSTEEIAKALGVTRHRVNEIASMTGFKVTSERSKKRAVIAQMLEDGYWVDDVCKELNVKKTYVLSVAYQQKIQTTDAKHKRMVNEEIFSAIKEGRSIASISKDLGVSKSKIYKMLEKQGLH